MKLRERATLLFKIIANSKNKTLEELAIISSIPKSSIQRHNKNQQTRTNSIGHDFFETAEGLMWLHRLYYGVIFIFGIQIGVGSETITLFFEKILINKYVAISPSSIRKIKSEIRTLIDIYGKEQTDQILDNCKKQDLHLGGDETWFGKSIFLVLMDLTSGFLLVETLTNSRTYKTWWKYAEEKIIKCKNILSFTSDGGQALLKLGRNLNCQPIMDLFHLLKDVKSLFATKFHSKKKLLLATLKKLSQKPLGSDAEQKKTICSINNELLTLDKGQQSYRNALYTISTAAHPFKNISTIHSSKELNNTLTQQLNILTTISEVCKIKDKKKLLNRFKKRIPLLSQLNDLWLMWVDQSIVCKTENEEIKAWAKEYVLPYYYFKEQLRKSKKKKRFREHYQTIVDQAKQSLETHSLTQEYLNDDWTNWAQQMSLKYQRTTSAIEGRNARLSQHYFSSRGVRKSHINPLTVIHNFWIKRTDQTTAAERLCGFKPPDLFEYLLQRSREIPLPRKRNAKLAAAI